MESKDPILHTPNQVCAFEPSSLCDHLHPDRVGEFRLALRTIAPLCIPSAKVLAVPLSLRLRVARSFRQVAAIVMRFG